MNKSAKTIGLTMATILTTACCYLICGGLWGSIFHPSSHRHDSYSCFCDESPILTQTEALVLGLILIIASIAVSLILLRKFDFKKWEQAAILLLILIINIYVCLGVYEILCTQVTG